MAARFSGVANTRPSAASTSAAWAGEACSRRTATPLSCAAPSHRAWAIWRVPPVIEWYTASSDLDKSSAMVCQCHDGLPLLLADRGDREAAALLQHAHARQ